MSPATLEMVAGCLRRHCAGAAPALRPADDRSSVAAAGIDTIPPIARSCRYRCDLCDGTRSIDGEERIYENDHRVRGIDPENLPRDQSFSGEGWTFEPEEHDEMTYPRALNIAFSPGVSFC
jgi:hypothetical protein